MIWQDQRNCSGFGEADGDTGWNLVSRIYVNPIQTGLFWTSSDRWGGGASTIGFSVYFSNTPPVQTYLPKYLSSERFFDIIPKLRKKKCGHTARKSTRLA